MLVIYKLSVFLHILSAMFWLGGMLFTVLVLVPATSHQALAPKKGIFFSEMGKRFSNISWILFSILLSTGYIQIAHRGYGFSSLFTSDFWQSHFGSILKYKLLAFAVMLIISGLHDFWLGPKAAKLIDINPTSSQTQSYRKATSWVGRLNLLLGLIILYYAISLVRG